MNTQQLDTGNSHTDSALFMLRREQFNMPVVARFTIEGEPVSKARARFTNRGSKSRAYTPEKVRTAEARVAWAFKAAAKPGYQPLDGDRFGVFAIFFNGTRQRRDVDNMLKLILDGLNGVAWVDDNQVLEVSGRKSYAPNRTEARTEVIVYWAGPDDAPTQKCEYCGSDFRTYESWTNSDKPRRFCSQDCHYASRRAARERECKHCGKTFEAHGPERETRYCSLECRRADGHVTIPCKICGTEFDQFRSWAESRPYCSSECVAENARRRARENRKRRRPGTCLICGDGTSRKEYVRCNACKVAGKAVPA